MKTQEMQKLRKILKPLVMECIKEAIFEEGVLSTLVAEIATGMNPAVQSIVEAPSVEVKKQNQLNTQVQSERVSQRLQESKNKILEAIGKDAYGGVNVFEGTEPLKHDSAQPQSPLANRDPRDQGVDIDGLLGAFGQKWNALK